MKVLLIGDYPPPYGGISVHVQQLSRFVAQSGAECRVLDIEPGTTSKEGAIRVRGYSDFLWNLMTFFFRGYVSHIHTNGHNFKSWLAIWVVAWVGFLFRRRNVATLHSGLMPAYVGAGGSLTRWFIKSALWPLGTVIAVNEEIERALSELKVARNRILVLPAFSLGARSSMIPEFIADCRAKFTPMVASAVYLEKEYGTELLIEACVHLREKYPHLGCLIMGSGREEETLRAQIKKSKGEEFIILLGNLPHELCLSVMEKSDLFVRPTYFDGDAISVREALALGIPTVASRVGFRPDGVFLFDPGNVTDLIVQMEKGLKEAVAAKGHEEDQNLAEIHRIYEKSCRGSV